MAGDEKERTFDEIKVLILPQRIQKRHLEIVKTAAKKRKLTLVENFGPEVTHIVTEFETVEQALRSLKLNSDSDLGGTHLLSLVWLTDSFKCGRPVDVTDHYRLQTVIQDEEEIDCKEKRLVAEWACQRATPLKHHNHKLTDAIEVLQQHAELRDGEDDYSRALAFRRASAVLKSLPFQVTDVSQVAKTKDIGGHVARVIKEILEEGHSNEIEQIVDSPWFAKMKLFSSVFGVGPSTAKKWIDRGWTSIDEAIKLDTSGDWRVKWGLAFHKDLMTRVERKEADNFTTVVRSEVQDLLPGATVELTGGFRRGKQNGHDVDLLISHPTEGAEKGLLPRLIQRLEKRGLILCGSHERNSFTPEVLTRDFKLSLRGQLDHFEKWLGICKFPQKFQEDLNPRDADLMPDRLLNGDKIDSLDEEYEPKAKMRKLVSGVSPLDLSASERDWTARRVDLIIAPNSQYYYALVGWTGGKHFNRDLRLYATKKLNMKLTSHGLYNMATGSSLPASSEQEVFKNLNLAYQEPTDRNC